MSWEHELTLYLLLGTFGISLLLPGLAGMFKPSTGLVWLVAEETDARSLNAMMTALGALPSRTRRLLTDHRGSGDL